MQFYVRDIMTTEPLTIKENVTLRDAIKIFSANEVSGLPVLDQDNNLVGVVSSTDVIHNESSGSFFSTPFKGDIDIELIQNAKFLDHPVSRIMSRNLFTIAPDATIAQMAKVMYEKKIHRLLVTENGTLTGIVTTFDLLKLLATSDESMVI